jgi:RNA polymerase sigma factor (sigma-70 family)
MVMRVCRALLGATADAEDAWSETFMSALRAYPRLRPDSHIAGWLATIAHHKAIDQLRVAQRRPRPIAEPPDVPTTDAATADDGLCSALAALPDKQRGAVVYRYLADLPYAQIAELLACSEPAARRNAADGVAHLRRLHEEGMF